MRISIETNGGILTKLRNPNFRVEVQGSEAFLAVLVDGKWEAILKGTLTEILEVKSQIFDYIIDREEEEPCWQEIYTTKTDSGEVFDSCRLFFEWDVD